MSTATLETHVESPAFIHAVDNHKYFMGIEGKPDAGFDEARDEFIRDYLLDWLRTNPHVEYQEKDKENLLGHCIHLREYNTVQAVAIKKALDNIRQNQGKPFQDIIAPEDFDVLTDLAVKWKSGWCLHICIDREKCYIAEKLYEQEVEEPRKEWLEREGVSHQANDFY